MKDIFFLWHLIIKMATLKDGDGEGYGGNTNAENNAANTDAAFGTNYSGALQNNIGSLIENEVDAWAEEQYQNSYSAIEDEVDSYIDSQSDYSNIGETGFDMESNTMYGYDATSSWSVSFDPETGKITEAYGSINTAVGEFENGVSSSYSSNMIGSSVSSIGYSTETGLAGDVSVANEFMKAINIGSLSLNTSFLGDVSINGYALGLFGNIGYKIGGIKAAQIAETLALGVSFYTGLQTLQAGMGIASLGYKGIGALISATGLYGLYSSMVGASALYGTTKAVSNSLASRGFYSDGDTDATLLIAIETAEEEVEATAASNLVFYTDMSSGTIFDKMAGGLLYDVQLAGNAYYDASNVNNPKVSVGAALKISKDSLRINNPYKDFDFPNLAGSDNWNVFNKI